MQIHPTSYNLSKQVACTLPTTSPADFQIDRRGEIHNRLSISNTTLHNRMKNGLLPTPIPLGGRAVGWLRHEIDAVLAAMVAEKGDDYIRTLVGLLLEQRKNAV